MKVTFEGMELGDGLVGFHLGEGDWSLKLQPCTAGAPSVTLTGTSPYELRRTLARLSAAIDIAVNGSYVPEGDLA